MKRPLIDVGEVLREVVEVRQHDFAAAGMSLTLERPRTPIHVLGNELELHQVFLNIVNNAYDALKEGTEAPRLAVSVSAADGMSMVVFADNGPGMKNTKQVFDHFYTTKPVGQGTGLASASPTR